MNTPAHALSLYKHKTRSRIRHAPAIERAEALLGEQPCIVFFSITDHNYGQREYLVIFCTSSNILDQLSAQEVLFRVTVVVPKELLSARLFVFAFR